MFQKIIFKKDLSFEVICLHSMYIYASKFIDYEKKQSNGGLSYVNDTFGGGWGIW